MTDGHSGRYGAGMEPLVLVLWSGLGVLAAGYAGKRVGDLLGGIVCGLLLGPVLGTLLIWFGTKWLKKPARTSRPASEAQPQTRP